jgi:hypothetical protein
MFSSRSLLKLIRPAACVLPVLLCFGRVGAQLPAPTPADLAIELKEAQATLAAASARNAEIEARLAKAKEQVNSIAESWASANGDAQQAREAYERLRIQMEGLGMAALDPSADSLQQRLLSAMSDLRILNGQKKELIAALLNLSQATLDYAKVAGPVDGEPRVQLDTRLGQAEQVLAKVQNEDSPVVDADLTDARVVSLKDDSGIAVFNVGSRHGVHPGMPFAIFRKDKPVASALVVDVRQDVCGAVVRDLVSKDDPVKVGDICKVDAVKN